MQSHLPEFDLLVPRPSAVLLEFVRGLGMNARLSKVSAGEGHHPSTHHARLRSLKIDRPEITIIPSTDPPTVRRWARRRGRGKPAGLTAPLRPVLRRATLPTASCVLVRGGGVGKGMRPGPHGALHIFVPSQVFTIYQSKLRFPHRVF